VPNLAVIKILILADVFFPDTIGGAGRVVNHLSFELAKRGHDVHVITRNPDRKLSAREKLDANLTVHRFPIPLHESTGLILSEIKNSLSLSKALCRDITFDLCCVHQSLVAIGPLLFGPLRKTPIVHFFHSPWHEEFLVKKEKDGGKAAVWANGVASLMKWAEKRVVLKASKVFVLSNYMADRAVELHGCLEDRLKRIPAGVDLDRFQLPPDGKKAAKEAANLSMDRTVFLTVRNLVPRMGLESLIQAFNQSDVLRSKALLLIGGEGVLKERLASMVEKNNLQGCIRLLGYISDQELPGLYQAAEFFVLPTKSLEGFGLVILEAMASGTPVLGTPVGGIPETLDKFDRRLIFEGTGWQEIRAKLEQTVEHPETFHFSPSECRKFVEDNFSWEKMADAFEEEMLKLVQKQL
jgi:glycosyltransferase involved in cell wall biosynthesis